MDRRYPTPQQTNSRVVSTAVPDLNAIVKAYDIRGIVPDQLDADVAYAIGVAFAKFANAPHIVIAHDMRPSGPELVDAFQRGVLALANSIRLAQCSRLRTTQRSTTESNAAYLALVPSELIMDFVKFMRSPPRCLLVVSQHSPQQQER
jgi:hypothetical protein